MEIITITIPKKILSGRSRVRRLIAVDPKEFEKKLRQKWEIKDAKDAIREARKAWKQGKARFISDLGEVIKS
ncbi:MAG: hypothetical protein HYT37_00325 [Candidatus Sungbacteria bacterium]|nr:hypothetical protein [Candidatus Sungbacteria bacterium]